MKKIFFGIVLLALLVVAYIFGDGLIGSRDYSEYIESLEDGVLVVGLEASYPPMESVDEDGNFIGFGVDMMQEIANRMGVNIEIVNTSWDGLFDMVKNGEVDVAASSISITPERAETMLFTNPYLNVGQVIVTKDGGVIKEADDLNGMRLAAYEGTTSEEEANKYSDDVFTYSDDGSEAVLKIQNDEVDALIVDYLPGAKIVNENEGFVIVGDPLTSEFYGIAAGMDKEELIEGINIVLSDMISDGYLEALKNKWLKE